MLYNLNDEYFSDRTRAGDKDGIESLPYNYLTPISVVDFCKYDPLFLEIIETMAFKRLSNIRFLGGIDYFLVPSPNGALSNARYTRYQHSLGVAYLSLLYSSIRHLREDDRRLLCAAALLHDIGHSPLSHSLEPVFEEEFGITHHDVARDIILGRSELGRDLNKILLQYKLDPERILLLISGKDKGFDGFFSGPINFDTVEGILRSRQYVRSRGSALSPISVISSAINRGNSRDKDIVDEFWRCKDEMYRSVIRSSRGALVDFVCQSAARRARNKIAKEDYLLTERDLFKKMPELREALSGLRSTEFLRSAVPDVFTYQVRAFFVDGSADFYSRDDSNRYKQSKMMRELPVRLGEEN